MRGGLKGPHHEVLRDHFHRYARSFPRRRESSTLGADGQAVATQCHLTHGGGYWIPACARMTRGRSEPPGSRFTIRSPAKHLQFPLAPPACAC
jgi:hypothetical protein